MYVHIHAQAGLVLRQGYVPEKRHANRTHNSHMLVKHVIPD